MKPCSLRLLALAALMAATPALAGPNVECPAYPADVNVIPGEEFRIGDKTFLVAAYVQHVHDGHHEDGQAAQAALSIDLLARYLDPVSREARRGTLVRGLRAAYTLRDALGSTVAEGTLEPRLTGDGPSYGTSLPVPESPGALSLSVSLAELPGSGDEIHPEHEDECPTPPFHLESLIEYPYGEEPWAGGPDEVDAADFRTSRLSHLDPRPSDNYSNIWGWNNGTTYLAVIGCTTGTVFLNVTDPANPVEVGFVDGPDSSWREIKSYLNYIYIVTEGSGTGQGLQIVNVSNPLSPTLVNTYSATFATAHTLFIDEQTGRAFINGTNTGMRLLSLANPVSPVELGAWTTRYVHDSYVKDGIACFSEINNGRQELLDVSNPGSIQLLSGWTTPGSFTHNCWSNDDYTLLVTTDENNPGGHLAVYDVTVKTSPGVLRAEYQPHTNSTVHNAYFEDDDDERVALSHYGVGMKLIDLHRPTAPLTLAAHDTYPSGETGYVGAWGMYNYDPRGYFYLSDIQTGFYLVRYDPTGGSLSGIVRDAQSLAPVGGATVVVLADGASAVSKADGVYAAYAPEGADRIRVSAPGYRSAVLETAAMPLDGRVDHDVQLQPLPKVALSGFVRRSDTSAAVSGAIVKVAGTALATTSLGDGSYAFPLVAIGQQTITAEVAGFSPAEVRLVLVEGSAALADLMVEPARFWDQAETNQGWTLGNVPGDTATSGRWERVDPNGTGGGNVQPENDHTPAPGTIAFITGQSAPGAPTETGDVDNGVTTLLSPVLDATGLGAAKLSYWRWMSNNAGLLSGGHLQVQVSSNNGTNWTTLEDQTTNANAWNFREFDLGSFVTLTNQMRFRFRAESTASANLSVLEAGVDDLEIVRACRTRFNSAAPDADRDGLVTACDTCAQDAGNDADGDGVCGDVDNAPFVANASQLDADGDGVGDVADNCGGVGNPGQVDLDADGAGDACDADLDGDGLANVDDADDDADGIADVTDRCPSAADPRQLDHDGDLVGDLCDANDGEVQGLALSGERITWEPETGSTAYNLYRGTMGAAALVHLASCRLGATTATNTVDPDLPTPGDGFFYLVSREVAGSEGTLGYTSAGAQRVLDALCP